MKNLPDKFPIRYAIIADANIDENDQYSDINQSLYKDDKIETLFNQYISLLQQEPINDSMLTPTSSTVKFTLSDIEIINISKLNAPFEWIENLISEIPKIINDAKPSWSAQNIFNIGLYSYKGTGEIPAFAQADEIITENKKDLIKIFGWIKDIDSIELFNDLWEKIKNYEITNYELYEALSKYRKPIYLSVPYSVIWELLDLQINNGIIPVSNKFNKKNIINEYNKFDKETLSSISKINIVLCRNWEELFAEEIMSLYKILNFCKNCGKALPFNYNGQYCHDNNECKKERSRLRKRKLHKN